jgi:hypothetical protein
MDKLLATFKDKNGNSFQKWIPLTAKHLRFKRETFKISLLGVPLVMRNGHYYLAQTFDVADIDNRPWYKKLITKILNRKEN